MSLLRAADFRRSLKRGEGGGGKEGKEVRSMTPREEGRKKTGTAPPWSSIGKQAKKLVARRKEEKKKGVSEEAQILRIT